MNSCVCLSVSVSVCVGVFVPLCVCECGGDDRGQSCPLKERGGTSCSPGLPLDVTSIERLSAPSRLQRHLSTTQCLCLISHSVQYFSFLALLVTCHFCLLGDVCHPHSLESSEGRDIYLQGSAQCLAQSRQRWQVINELKGRVANKVWGSGPLTGNAAGKIVGPWESG